MNAGKLSVSRSPCPSSEWQRMNPAHASHEGRKGEHDEQRHEGAREGAHDACVSPLRSSEEEPSYQLPGRSFPACPAAATSTMEAAAAAAVWRKLYQKGTGRPFGVRSPRPVTPPNRSFLSSSSSFTPLFHFKNPHTTISDIQHHPHYHLLAILTSDNEIYVCGTQNSLFDPTHGRRDGGKDQENGDASRVSSSNGVCSPFPYATELLSQKDSHASSSFSPLSPSFLHERPSIHHDPTAREDLTRHMLCVDVLCHHVTQLCWGPWQNGVSLLAVCSGKGLYFYHYAHRRWTRDEALSEGSEDEKGEGSGDTPGLWKANGRPHHGTASLAHDRNTAAHPSECNAWQNGMKDPLRHSGIPSSFALPMTSSSSVFSVASIHHIEFAPFGGAFVASCGGHGVKVFTRQLRVKKGGQTPDGGKKPLPDRSESVGRRTPSSRSLVREEEGWEKGEDGEEESGEVTEVITTDGVRWMAFSPTRTSGQQSQKKSRRGREEEGSAAAEDALARRGAEWRQGERRETLWETAEETDGDTCVCVAWSTSGLWISAGYRDGTIRLYAVEWRHTKAHGDEANVSSFSLCFCTQVADDDVPSPQRRTMVPYQNRRNAPWTEMECGGTEGRRARQSPTTIGVEADQPRATPSTHHPHPHHGRSSHTPPSSSLFSSFTPPLVPASRVVCHQLTWAPLSGRSFMLLLSVCSTGIVLWVFPRPPGVSEHRVYRTSGTASPAGTRRCASAYGVEERSGGGGRDGHLSSPSDGYPHGHHVHHTPPPSPAATPRTAASSFPSVFPPCRSSVSSLPLTAAGKTSARHPWVEEKRGPSPAPAACGSLTTPTERKGCPTPSAPSPLASPASRFSPPVRSPSFSARGHSSSGSPPRPHSPPISASVAPLQLWYRIPIACGEVRHAEWNSTGTQFMTAHRDSAVHVWRVVVTHTRRRLAPFFWTGAPEKGDVGHHGHSVSRMPLDTTLPHPVEEEVPGDTPSIFLVPPPSVSVRHVSMIYPYPPGGEG